jgi:ketosteroid isomerase-like protein
MTQANIELIQTIYDALDSGDHDSVLDHVDDDIEVIATEGLPWSGHYYGREAAADFLRSIEEHVQVSIETDELIDSGTSVAQVGRLIGHAHNTGLSFDTREIHIWTLRRGKVVTFQNYIDSRAQREALGLSPEEPPADDMDRGSRETFWG